MQRRGQANSNWYALITQWRRCRVSLSKTLKSVRLRVAFACLVLFESQIQLLSDRTRYMCARTSAAQCNAMWALVVSGAAKNCADVRAEVCEWMRVRVHRIWIKSQPVPGKRRRPIERYVVRIDVCIRVESSSGTQGGAFTGPACHACLYLYSISISSFTNKFSSVGMICEMDTKHIRKACYIFTV